MTRLLCQLFLLLISSVALAHDMIPAPAQQQAILLKNATVHTVIAGTKFDTDVLLINGVIDQVGRNLQHRNAIVHDLSGKQLYPGLIALNTTLGLNEIEMVRATVDKAETGRHNPDLVAATAFNPDSELIPTVRVNGISHAQITPRGKGLTGQSILVNLDSWTIDDAIVATPTALHLVWPDNPKPHRHKTEKKAVASQQQQVDDIIQTFIQARHFNQAGKITATEPQTLRWQAMAGLFDGSAKLFIHADSKQQLEQIIQFAKQFELGPVIVGGYDAWQMAAALKRIKATIIYPHVFSLPRRDDEPIDLPFSIPAKLAAAKLPFALAQPEDWNSRNLPFTGGQSIAYGLSYQAALKALTLTPAQLLGINDMGAIAPGYRASLVVSEGDLFDPLTNRVTALFIDGRQVDLNNRHRQLYQKYLKR